MRGLKENTIFKVSLIEAILSRTTLDPNTGCLNWTGAKHKFGYGQVSISNKTHNVYRLIFEFINGPLQKGIVVRHKCDNPACCNITHLESGTRKDNQQDMIQRGRGKGQFKKQEKCKNGHNLKTTRVVQGKSSYCKLCQIVRSRAASKRNFQKNKTNVEFIKKAKARSKKFREKHRQEIAEKKRLWRQKRKELGFKVT
jgi:hypothetical protein